MAADSAHPVWGLSPEVAWARTPAGDAVVMALDEGHPLLLSASGAVVWDVLMQDRTPEDDLTADPPAPLPESGVAAQVAEAFGLSPAEVGADVRAFLEMLESHGVLVRIPAA